jgi:hypothetical protein
VLYYSKNFVHVHIFTAYNGSWNWLTWLGQSGTLELVAVSCCVSGSIIMIWDTQVTYYRTIIHNGYYKNTQKGIHLNTVEKIPFILNIAVTNTS